MKIMTAYDITIKNYNHVFKDSVCIYRKLLYSKGAAIHEDIAAVFADAVERKGKRV